MSNYYFINATRCEMSAKPLFGDNITWVARLNRYSKEEIRAFFESVIEANKWGMSDVIYACPDDESEPNGYEGGKEDV